MKKTIIILCLLLLTGCNDYVEINDLGIVTGMAIDYVDNEYELTSQLIVNEKESKVAVYTTKGKTIEEAIAKTSKLLNKEYYISFIKILIVTDNLLTSNENYYDYFLRESKSKMNFYVYQADSNIAKEILNIYKKEDGSSLFVDKMMTFNTQLFSSSVPLEFITLVYNSLEPGINPVYPTIGIKKNNNEKIISLNNIVSYNKKKEKIELNEIESIMYNMITNNTKDTILSINCDNELFTMNIEESNSKFKWENDKFKIELEMIGKINDYNCSYDITKKESLEKLKNLSTTYITNQIDNLINKAKEKRNDFIGIGNFIYRRDKKYRNKNIINNWDYEFNNIEVIVKPKMSIISTGELRIIEDDKNAKNK